MKADRSLGRTPRVSDPVRMVWGPRDSASNHSMGEAAVAAAVSGPYFENH